MEGNGTNFKDGYTANMNEHSKNCFQAHGLSPSGADQLANEQMPELIVDKLMLGAYNKPEWSEHTDPSNTNCWIDKEKPNNLLEKKPKDLLYGSSLSPEQKSFGKENGLVAGDENQGLIRKRSCSILMFSEKIKEIFWSGKIL